MKAITPDRVMAASKYLEAAGFADIVPVLMDYALVLQGVPVQRDIPVTCGCKRVKLIIEDRITAEVFRQHCKATGYAHAAVLVSAPTTGSNDTMRRPPWHNPEPPSRTEGK